MFDLNKILPIVLNLLSGVLGSTGKPQPDYTAPDYNNAGCSSTNFDSGGGVSHSHCDMKKQAQHSDNPSYNTNFAPNGSQFETTTRNPNAAPPPDFSNAYWSLPTYNISTTQPPPFETQTTNAQPENKPMFDINLIIQIVNQLASMFSNNVSAQRQTVNTKRTESSQKHTEKDEKKEHFSFISKYPRTDQFVFS